ncbi:MAG: hypothetical protein HOC91_14440 [Nitrospinaceae bacterium]|jgi:hypothetical protein|nr:hypothetical protein [Nitrospinaceae bacterium]MBT5368191.1 hypothetical protein [Nitrospinaceae bacterium]MBT6395776.1 hypothetical protein [Nitrospinaceae bacterium]
MTSATDNLLSRPPFSLNGTEKQKYLSGAVTESIAHHYENCPPYRKWMNKQGFAPSTAFDDLSEIPYLPAALFKHMDLVVGEQDDIVKILASSGVSSQIPSRVPIDNVTRTRQMKALTSVMSDFFGGKRRPFLLADVEPSRAEGNDVNLSARIAGMRGYLMAASQQVYILDDVENQPRLNESLLQKTVEDFKISGTPFSVLGYTYMVYKYVIQPLYEQGICLDFPEETFLLHFGGWKMLQDQAVTREILNEQASAVFGIPAGNVRDIYGFTEQLGVIYPDNGNGVKRTPCFSEVIVRDPLTLEPVPDGEYGLLEFITPLPNSYPGAALLLDDIGRIVTREPGPDGKHGTSFEIIGRAPESEVRGCGDTLPDHIYEISSDTN